MNKPTPDELRALLKNPEHLSKAYKLAKELLLEQYGDEFSQLDKEQQAAAAGHILATLLEL